MTQSKTPRRWADFGPPLAYSPEQLRRIKFFTVPKSRALRETLARIKAELDERQRLERYPPDFFSAVRFILSDENQKETFDEKKHPRGQPGNPGQFVEKAKQTTEKPKPAEVKPVKTFDKDSRVLPLIEKGIARTENKNIKADFTEKQWNELLASDRTEPGPVWGSANKDNEDAKAFAFINSKHYHPIDKNTGVVDTNFTGEVTFEKANDWTARRRFAQAYIKQPEFATRKELPELLRTDVFSSKVYDTIEVGKPFKLTVITATSADRTFENSLSKFRAGINLKFKKPEKVVLWHYKRDDVFERNVGNVRVTDGSWGSKKRPYELTVGGNTAIVDKIEEKNGITHVYAHLEDD